MITAWQFKETRFGNPISIERNANWELISCRECLPDIEVLIHTEILDDDIRVALVDALGKEIIVFCNNACLKDALFAVAKYLKGTYNYTHSYEDYSDFKVVSKV
jgi:hypothetical protein